MADKANVFWDEEGLTPDERNYVVHQIARSMAGETPGGSECIDYEAECGELAFEYNIGTPYKTKFAATFEDASLRSTRKLKRCPGCFPESKNETAVRFVVIERSRAERDQKLGLPDNNGRKVCATSVMEQFGERKINDALWDVGAVLPTGNGSFEVSTFSEYSGQDRHMHKTGTEIYTVIRGRLFVWIDDADLVTLEAGDEIVILPETVHQVVQQKRGSASAGAEYELLVRVHSLDCRGADDKFVQLTEGGDWVQWSSLSKERRSSAIKK